MTSQMLGQSRAQRFKPPGGTTDPVGERRAIEFEAVSRKNLRLAIERNVVAVFADQNVGEQPGACQPFRDWTVWCRCLMQLAAGSTSVLGAANADDAKTGRNIVQHFADGLADFVDFTATAWASGGIDVKRHVLTIEMIRQTETAFDAWRNTGF